MGVNIMNTKSMKSNNYVNSNFESDGFNSLKSKLLRNNGKKFHPNLTSSIIPKVQDTIFLFEDNNVT